MTGYREILCPPCPRCGKQQSLTVSAAGLAKYDNGRGAHIQVAFPELNADERELLLTGYCIECWDAMFSEDEEEE